VFNARQLLPFSVYRKLCRGKARLLTLAGCAQTDGREEFGEDITGQTRLLLPHVTPGTCCIQEGLRGASAASTTPAKLTWAQERWRGQSDKVLCFGNQSRLDRLSGLPDILLLLLYSCKAQLNCREQELYCISFRIPQSSSLDCPSFTISSPFITRLWKTQQKSLQHSKPANITPKNY